MSPTKHASLAPRRSLGARAFAALAAVAVGAAFASTVRPAQRAESTLRFPQVEEVVLDNGFRMLVVTDRRVPRVSASLWYRVGGLQEVQNEHGSTHFLEHMVFQGTTTVGTKDFEAEKPILREIADTEWKLIEARNRDRNALRERDLFHNDLVWPSTPEIDALRQKLYELEDRQVKYREHWAEYNWYRRYGSVGTHTDPVPAMTGHEQLYIDIDLPREHLELLFRLEADRMVNAVMRGWEAQRFTVLEQILGGRQQPADGRGRFYEVINGVTGVNHNIFLRSGGHLRDFAFYTRAAMAKVYDEFFVPNNATLVLVGDVTAATARSFGTRYFGRIPRGAAPPARMDLEAEVVPGGAVRLDWMEPADDRVLVRHRMPAVGHAQRPVFDVMAAVLRDRNGLVAERLRARRLDPAGIQVQAGRSGSPGTLDILVLARREHDLPALEAGVLEAVGDLRAGRIDAALAARAATSLRLDWAATAGDRQQLAVELGRFQSMDTWRTLQAYYQSRDAVTVEDIRAAAQRYLMPANSVTVTARRQPQHARPAPTSVPTDGVP